MTILSPLGEIRKGVCLSGNTKNWGKLVDRNKERGNGKVGKFLLLFNMETLMRKALVLFIAIILATGLLQAQMSKAGGGFGYTTGYSFRNQDTDADKSNPVTLFFKGIIDTKTPLKIAPALTYFLPTVTKTESVDQEVKTTLTTVMLDVNGHYNFSSSGKIDLYGMAGFDIMISWRKELLNVTSPTPFTDRYTESDNAIGLNIGAGGIWKISDKTAFMLETKYLLSRYDQVMVNFGLLLSL
jgi:hypothetical protein